MPAILVAEIYKTVDENGRVIFTDKPIAHAQEIEVDTKANNVEGLSTSSYSNADEIITKKRAKQKTVVMYSTSWCGVCKNARSYMQSNGIRFKEYDIEKNTNAHSKYQKLGGKGVPLITVGDNKMSGFSASKLEAMLR